MDPTQQQPNPYLPPAVGLELASHPPLDQGAPLADRGSRLGAALLDGLIASLPLLIACIVGFVVSFGDMAASGMFKQPPGEPVPPEVVFEKLTPLFIAFGLGALGMLGIGIYQCYRIATTGQSMAKKWLGIRIVLVDGSPVSFGSGVGMRAILPWFLSSIPYIGSLFWLVDILFIFRDDRRCLHDLMANTKVVVAPKD
jgi:uncharacterized RDD family membrane protein YckC